MKHRFERIGDRARVAVQALDEIVWATNPMNDNLASFAEYVSRFSDEFFEYTNIRCWQEVPTATFRPCRCGRMSGTMFFSPCGKPSTTR